MKHLIGLLFCIGFLLFAGTTDSQAQTATSFATTYQVSCLDIGKPKLCIGKPSVIQVLKGFAVDILKHNRIAFMKSSEALFYRYSFVPKCPVMFISKGYERYFYHNQLYYIKPPYRQSNLNI